ncbi:hypothetical protein Tco_0908811 [Tanacetum coccineum]|uniref:Uncharacterized protein n=1 Tax=Tanacetum coccineum TaxID=301880 RepID=A0ABQ5CN69_9ASTR
MQCVGGRGRVGVVVTYLGWYTIGRCSIGELDVGVWWECYGGGCSGQCRGLWWLSGVLNRSTGVGVYEFRIIADFESRVREILTLRDTQVQVVDFQSGGEGCLYTRGPLLWELILEFLSNLRLGEDYNSGRQRSPHGFLLGYYKLMRVERIIPWKGITLTILRNISMTTDGDFLGPIPAFPNTLIRDPVLETMAHRMNGTQYSWEESQVKKIEAVLDTKMKHHVFRHLLMMLSVRTVCEYMALPPRKQRHRFLRYEGMEYTDSDIVDFESRLERIYTREIHRVQVVDFQGRARRRLSWRQFSLALGLHTGDEMESSGFARYYSESERMIPRKGDIHDYWRDISTDGDFLGPPPSYTLIRDPVLRLCHRMMAHNIVGRSQVIAPELPMIDMAELVRLHICVQLDDTWAWVAMGPERQPDAAAGAPAVAEDTPAVDEGDQAILAPVQAP